MRGGGWDAAPSPCPVLPATARGPACKGFILPPPPPETLLQALFPAPSFIFHPPLIPFPRSGLSCPGNDSPISSVSLCTQALPCYSWLSAPPNL